MVGRYSRNPMAKIWSDEIRFKKWLQVEIAAVEALAELDVIPQDAVEEIKKKCDFKIADIRSAEEKTKHEIVAFLNVLQEKVGDDASRWIHFGLTSSDVLDTALGLQLKDASEIIIEDIETLQTTIKNLATKYQYTPIMGRTHGVHAEPTTVGLKFAVWFDEISRAKRRIENAFEETFVGKMSGVVGNFANIDPEVEEKAMEKLKLTAEPAASQIVHRDRYAFLIATCAILAGSIEKIATEIRNLQRTEVGEMEEPFSSGQHGSSAMPHKRNPVQCEQVCGLARLIRSYTVPALENIVLWHERDISHSSVERVIIPDTMILLDYILDKMNELLAGIVIHPDKMLQNIELTKGHIFSQRLMMRLIKSGVPRQKAHLVIQGKIMSSWRKGEDFKQQVVKDGEIRRYISLEEIEALFDLDIYIRYVDYIFKRVFPKKKK
jgi:adenylosuccinate lyase